MDKDFPGQSIIDALDQDISDALVRFGDQVSAAESELLVKVQGNLDGLVIDSAGTLRQSVANLRQINEVRRTLQGAQASGLYSQAVQGLVGQLGVQAQGLNGYFSVLRAGFKPRKLYGALVEEYTAATVAQLYTGALQGVLEPALTKAITTSLTDGALIKDLRKQVSKVIVEDRTLAARAETIADNALNQFNRNYTQAVTDDLGLKHYFFKGTIIETSRTFCKERVGKYFTLDEVLNWADLTFAGKIKDTDRTNIRTNLGGNRCRHRLVPITEHLYNEKTGRAGQLALFE